VGKQSFVKSPQIANWQIFGLIPLSQIRKFVTCASPQIANSQVFMINTQIANPPILTKYGIALLCLKPVLKVVFLNDFIMYNF
jgi:hypothetical protein